MLEIFYKTGLYAYSTTKKDIKGGMVAAFTDDREISICNEKTTPIGFFIMDYESLGPPYVPPIATVLVGQSEFRTDVFEKSEYKHGDFLYCSHDGKITNESKYKGNIIIGIVNFVSDEFIGLVTCFARRLEG